VTVTAAAHEQLEGWRRVRAAQRRLRLKLRLAREVAKAEQLESLLQGRGCDWCLLVLT
jgi:hypothetical protein